MSSLPALSLVSSCIITIAILELRGMEARVFKWMRHGTEACVGNDASIGCGAGVALG
jgi:hypothetical protein